MTAATAGAIGTAQAPSERGLDSPEARGTLRIDDRVVERVASYAVSLVEHAVAAPRRILGVNVGDARVEDAPSVSASVQGTAASIAATIAVAWPHPIPDVVEQVRRRVRDEVEAVTGVRIDHVDVEVTSLDVPVRSVARVR